jgi:hypothetical protein
MDAVQVRHGAIIALAEPFPIVLAFIARHMGMPKFFAIFHVRLAVVVEILARAFYSIMKPLALRVAELRRRRIPIMVVILLGDSRSS